MRHFCLQTIHSMLDRIINWSISNKLIIFLLIAAWIGLEFMHLTRLSIGAVPDVTNNQGTSHLTTSTESSTEGCRKIPDLFPVELRWQILPGVKKFVRYSNLVFR